MRLGILGGTFDPVHVGHVAAAHLAIECAHLDRVLLVPSARPPHRGPALASTADRLEMCRLAVADEERLDVSAVETLRDGPSYTIDTIRELKDGSSDDLLLILGVDAARLFNSWHRPQEITDLVEVALVARPGTARLEASEIEGVGLPIGRTRICEGATPEVSASDIRRAVAAGSPITGLVTPAVEAYIAEHRLYLG